MAQSGKRFLERMGLSYLVAVVGQVEYVFSSGLTHLDSLVSSV
jgi:hypothetical protein